MLDAADNPYVLLALHAISQKYSRLRKPLQEFSSLFKAEPLYEGRLKVIVLLQVSRHDFEPTFSYHILSELKNQPK